MKRKHYLVRTLVHFNIGDRRIVEAKVRASSDEQAINIIEDRIRSERNTPLESKAFLERG